jgi:hypothetical protein
VGKVCRVGGKLERLFLWGDGDSAGPAIQAIENAPIAIGGGSGILATILQSV